MPVTRRITTMTKVNSIGTFHPRLQETNRMQSLNNQKNLWQTSALMLQTELSLTNSGSLLKTTSQDKTCMTSKIERSLSLRRPKGNDPRIEWMEEGAWALLSCKKVKIMVTTLPRLPILWISWSTRSPSLSKVRTSTTSMGRFRLISQIKRLEVLVKGLPLLPRIRYIDLRVRTVTCMLTWICIQLHNSNFRQPSNRVRIQDRAFCNQQIPSYLSRNLTRV